ncbi:unnamed protein product [Musa banksii]
MRPTNKPASLPRKLTRALQSTTTAKTPQLLPWKSPAETRNLKRNHHPAELPCGARLPPELRPISGYFFSLARKLVGVRVLRNKCI